MLPCFVYELRIAESLGFPKFIKISFDDLSPVVFARFVAIHLHNLEPQTTIYTWLFQLDDSQFLHRKWLEITKHPFTNGCLGFQVYNYMV